MQAKQSAGHLAAIVTILIWGTTYVSTKVLLRTFTPVEILFTRFVIGLLALTVIYPKRLRLKDKREHLLFAAAGLCGITLYYLLENIALTMTTATNAGIIVTVSPFFIALFARWFLKAEKPRPQFYLGFLVAMAGIVLISYNGSTSLQLNPMGDFLALLSAITWAVYSILTRKIGELGYNTIQTTRRIFLYGLIFMLPTLFFLDFSPSPAAFASPVVLGNILFLGFGASALCFVTWNTAVKLLGAVKTGVYIYLVPVVTLASSALILNEPLTPLLLVGAVLTLVGLWLSGTKLFRRKPAIRPH